MSEETKSAIVTGSNETMVFENGILKSVLPLNTPISTNSNNNPSAFSVLEDNTGGLSSIRILMLLWGVGVFIVWAFTCYTTNSLVTIPESVLTILLGISGVKSIQRFAEK